MKKLISLALILALLVIGGGLVYFNKLSNSWSQAAAPAGQEILVNIPKGSSSTKIGSILRKNGMIVDERSFKIFLKVKGIGPKLKAGRFLLKQGMSFEELTEVITKGIAASRKVTIPEGRASFEIFSILKKTYPQLDSLKWERLVHDQALASRLGVPFKNLEGYLYPDTYQLPWEADELTLIKILVKRFFSVWNSLDKENSKVFKRLGFHGVITLAAIVEEESSLASERPQVAGVYYNRVLKNWPLGADPTVRFIFRNMSGPIYMSQLRSDHPYNTRNPKNKGLPPGPIASPGKEALQATLYPDKTPYLFFVGKDDGSKSHYFTTNLADHNKYKEIAAQNRVKRGRDKGAHY